VQTNGPCGGNVHSFAASSPNLFAGTLGGGVFLSTNNGTSWTATALQSTDVFCLAVNSADSGTGSAILFAGSEFGIVYTSNDNGASWSASHVPWPATEIYALAVAGPDLFAGNADYDVFRSTDNGTTWMAVNNGLTDIHVYGLAVSGTNLFAGTWAGVFVSTDRGTSWTPANTPFSDFPQMVQFESNLFAATNGGVIFRSTNNGTSWMAVNGGLNVAVYALAIAGDNLFAGTNRSGVWRRPLSEMVTACTRTGSKYRPVLSFNRTIPTRSTQRQPLSTRFLSEQQ
jgi:photosystem II stability/assembly factor-like uncharacterized protein